MLVQERLKSWTGLSFPGGHVEPGEGFIDSAVREVKEETGLDVVTKRIIAIQDRNKHNKPKYAYGICKIFVLCEVIGGKFEENIETTEIEYFDLNNLPNLAEEKNNKEQIEMCFNAYKDENWKVQFD